MKDFMKRVDKDTDKVMGVMEAFQEYLDKAVAAGAMTEHEARMEFASQTAEVVGMIGSKYGQEEDDDDAEDEQGDGDDESSEEDDECPMPKIVEWFVEHPDVFEALKVIHDCPYIAGNIVLDFDNAVRSYDRS